MTRLQELTSSRWVTRLGLWLARALPPRLGHGVAAGIARLVVAREPAVYHTVCANLRQILGPAAPPEAVADRAARLFHHALLCHYDFFRAQGESADALANRVPIPAWMLAEIAAIRAGGQGVLLLGIHTSNFDLGLLSFGAHGLPVQALSLANPPAGFQLLNELRARAGFEVTPISPNSLRQAIRRLRNGGIVITGVDRPVADDSHPISFFGRPACLPLGPARLARLTGAAVILGACHYAPETGYHINAVGPLDLQQTRDREADILANTSRFAAFMETQIRPRPEQWLMFHPVWPTPAEAPHE